MVASVDEYLASLPEDRAETLAAVRALVAEYVPAGYEERFQYGMISWVVPLERYPDTHNGQPAALISLGNQKRKMSMYLMGVYGEEATRDRFVERWKATGKRLDMGKSCVRFGSLDDLPLEVLAEVVGAVDIDTFVARCVAARSARPRRAAKKRATKATAKGSTTKRTAKRAAQKK